MLKSNRTENSSKKNSEDAASFLGLSSSEAWERGFWTLARSVCQLMIVCNIDGGWLRHQRGWEELVQEGKCEGFSWTTALHPEDTVQTVNTWKCGVKSRTEFAVSYRLVCKDGKYRRFNVRVIPLTDASIITGWLALHTETTDAQDALHKNSQLLRELNDLKAAIDEHAIVAVTDPKGKITYVNDKFCAISKYSRDELIGRDHRLINSGYHSKAFITTLWKTIVRGSVWKGEITQQTLRELNDVKAAIDEHAIVAITDRKGKITYVNDKFCAISKYNRDELLGQDHRIINSGYHPKTFIRHIWETITDGRVWKGEIKNKAKDGTFYWVDTTIVPYLGEDGQPIQYIAIRADITDRKKAAEETAHALRELNDVQCALDEHAIVAVTDKAGKITSVNEKFCAISKFRRDELIGQDHRIINSAYHPKQFIRSIWQTIGSGRVWKGEIKNKAKDGSFYWVDTTIVPYLGEDGKPTQYIAIRADITDRKIADEQTAQALRELNDLKAAIDEHAIVAITDHKGKINYVNDKFCAISKYSREELLNQDHRIINSGFHSKLFIRTLWETISGGRVWKGEIKNKAKDGTFYWVDTTIVPYLGEDGKPVQYIAIRADITERKAAETALEKARNDIQQHATTLEQTVAARTSSLRETIGELEAFSYSISHDMRAPLRAMQSFSQILADECNDQISPDGHEYIRRIVSSAARMDGLIQDVLTYSKVARTELALEPVNFKTLLIDIIATYPTFQSPQADIEVIGDIGMVAAIPAVLTQCISNLIGNAVKFVSKGTKPHVRIWSSETASNFVRIYFKDNGVGIDKDAHETIFGMFQRATRDYEGSGIGLSIVKKGAERMGGSVGLTSEPGKGSEFWLELKKYSG